MKSDKEKKIFLTNLFFKMHQSQNKTLIKVLILGVFILDYL